MRSTPSASRRTFCGFPAQVTLCACSLRSQNNSRRSPALSIVVLAYSTPLTRRRKSSSWCRKRCSASVENCPRRAWTRATAAMASSSCAPISRARPSKRPFARTSNSSQSISGYRAGRGSSRARSASPRRARASRFAPSRSRSALALKRRCSPLMCASIRRRDRSCSTRRNSARRCSTGIGVGCTACRATSPHRRPSTRTGREAEERTPILPRYSMCSGDTLRRPE